MAFGFPSFESSFLRTICSAIDSRSKSLRYHSQITFEFKNGVSNDPEWLFICFAPLVGPEIQFYFDEQNKVSIFIRGLNTKRKHITYFELSDLQVFSNSELILKAIESTIALSYQFKDEVSKDEFIDGLSIAEIRATITAEWMKAAARIKQ